MSIYHSIDLYLAEKFNEKNITIILKHGLELGFIYFNNIENKEYEEFKLIDLNEAVNRILNYDSNLMEYGPLIETKFEDTRIPLRIYQYNSYYLKIDFGFLAAYPWIKQFWNLEGNIYFDTSRYTQLLLKLCEDFTIIKIDKNIL